MSKNSAPPPPDPNERVPPRDVESELASLGSALISRRAVDTVLETLVPEDFYVADHQKVAEAIRYLALRDDPVDPLTVGKALAQRHPTRWSDLEAVNLATTIAEGIHTAAHVEYYARKVKEAADERRILHAGQAIIEIGYSAEMETEAKIGAVEEIAFGIGTRRQRVPIYSSADMVCDHLYSFHPSAEEDAAFPSPFPTLNEFLNGGFKPHEFSLLAARPSQGKTAASVELALSLAMAGVSVGYVSLEGKAKKILPRFITVLSGVPLKVILRRKAYPELWQKIMVAGDQFSALPLHLTDETGLDAQALCALIRRMVREKNVQFVIVDQLQRISRDPRAESEAVGYTRIVQTLQTLADKLGIHLLLNCQLNRKNESREDKRPFMSDLGDTGALERSARVILALHRPNYYQRGKEDGHDSGEGEAELLVLKNDDGEVGTVHLRCNLAYGRFWEPAKAAEQIPHAPELAYEETAPPPEDPGARYRSH